MITTGYLGLFLFSFLAATIIPFSSEAMLATLLATKGYDFWILVGFATLGNTLGAVVNWALGGWCLRFQDHKYFPISKAHLEKAVARFNKWGHFSLLLAWVPIIGDPITFAAGVLRTSFFPFIILVAIGKGFRYLLIAIGVEQINF